MANHDREGGPCRRSDLATNGITRDAIPGLVLYETQDFGKTWGDIERETKETYARDEVYGQFCNVNGFIEAPFDMVFDYVSNVYSLEEWTLTLRNFVHVGGRIYKCNEMVAPDTVIYMQIDSHRECGVVDHLCAWDQGEELWMRYHFRLLDGIKTVGRPGTVVCWVNAKHPYYERDRPVPPYVARGRERTDRAWVGDLWKHFHPGHSLEFQNMKRILEYRWRHG